MPKGDERRERFRGRPSTSTLLGALAILGVLTVARSVFIPIALAVLAATLLGPLVVRLEGRLGRTAAAAIAVSAAVALVLGSGWFFGAEVGALARELPDYAQNAAKKLAALRTENHPTIARLEEAARDLARELDGTPRDVPQVRVVQTDSVFATLGPATFVIDQIVTIVLVIALVFFLLAHAETLRDKLVRLFGRSNVALTTRALTTANQQIGRYLLLQTVVNALVGAVVGFVLFAYGVPEAPLWGAIWAVLRFVPYVGTAISATLPALVAFGVTPGWAVTILAPITCAAVDTFSAYVLEPAWVGRWMGVSPVALLLSAVVWSWMWGPIGLVLSTAIAVSLRVIGETVPALGFLDVLFGPSSRLDPHLKLLGRLIAHDEEGAKAVAERIAAERGWERLFEEVLVPALTEVGRARASGRIDEGAARAAVGLVRGVVEGAGPFEPRARGMRALVVEAPSAEGGADLGPLMIAQALRARGHDVELVAAEAASAETVRAAAEQGVDVALVFIGPGDGLVHALAAAEVVRAVRPEAAVAAAGPGARAHAAELARAGCEVAPDLAALRRVLLRTARRARFRAARARREGRP
jgi:predicted PurR-regulated permease PerM